MELFKLQDLIFGGEPTRAELAAYQADGAVTHRVAVYRNHSFELVQKTIAPFCAFAGMNVEFIYSDYDDSLSFADLDTSVDLVIVWVDATRYKIDNVTQFLAERIKSLSSSYSGRILLAVLGEKIDTPIASILDLSGIEAKMGRDFIDMRMEPYSGTRLSAKACMAVSRELGLNYLPVLLGVPLKGIIVDLDNTLYKGVLGEDGVQGVELTQGHIVLQRHLKLFSQQGLFLGIASKNDEIDVRKLLEERVDFVLKPDDFAYIKASWNDKAESIQEIADLLNIHSSSLLFIDDNLGEIVSVLERHPDIKTIWAQDDAEITARALAEFPGLLKLAINKEDRLRKADVLANKERETLKNSLSKDDYIKSLQIEVTYSVNELSHSNRVAELANKTNQFIFSYQRYTHQQICNLMNANDSVVVSISMKDKLSDSGIIGVIVARANDELATLEECFVSCRALGRGLDEVIVLGAVQSALTALKRTELTVLFVEGERNAPARKFCDTYLSGYIERKQRFEYIYPDGLVDLKFEKGKEDA
ncbi:HAD-IIIC family phosphatase [Brucella pseudogrignonensis]|jgi:FkbH-like protein